MLHEKLKVNQIKPSIALENTKVTIMVSMGIYLLTFNLLCVQITIAHFILHGLPKKAIL